MALGTIEDRQINSFVEVQTGVPGRRGVDNFAIKITDVKNSSITYVGESIEQDADTRTDEGIFRIKRILRVGSETFEAYAGDGIKDFTLIWDDRDDGVTFPVPALDNTQSLLMDGLNDEANGGDIFQFDSANQWSLSMWCKPDNLAATRALFSKTTPDSNVWGWNLKHNVTTGALFLQMRASGKLRSFTYNKSLVAATWQHVVFTFSGSENISGALVYLDGVVGNTPTSGTLGTMLSGQDFNLGSRNTTQEFSGNIDQVTVWDKALAQSEVTTLYNSGSPNDPSQVSFSSDLVSWYPIGEDEGDSAVLLVDNEGSNDLTILNASSTPFESDVP